MENTNQQITLRPCRACKRLVLPGHDCRPENTAYSWHPGQTVEEEPRWRAAIAATSPSWECKRCDVGYHKTVHGTVVPCKCALLAIYDQMREAYGRACTGSLSRVAMRSRPGLGGRVFTRPNEEFAAEFERVVRRAAEELDNLFDTRGFLSFRQIAFYFLCPESPAPWTQVFQRLHVTITADSRKRLLREVNRLKYLIVRRAVTLKPYAVWPMDLG